MLKHVEGSIAPARFDGAFQFVAGRTKGTAKENEVKNRISSDFLRVQQEWPIGHGEFRKVSNTAFTRTDGQG